MSETTSEIIQFITSATALAVSIFAVVKYFFIPRHERQKYSAETQQADAVASKTFEEAAKLASERANALEIRLKTLEDKLKAEIDRLNGIIKERDLRITNLVNELQSRDAVIASLKDWSERLVHQIQGWGENPVPFDVKTRPHPRK